MSKCGGGWSRAWVNGDPYRRKSRQPEDLEAEASATGREQVYQPSRYLLSIGRGETKLMNGYRERKIVSVMEVLSHVPRGSIATAVTSSDNGNIP